jgi:hypothetical protein
MKKILLLLALSLCLFSQNLFAGTSSIIGSTNIIGNNKINEVYATIASDNTTIAIWGLTKLNNLYAGNCLRIRRASDNSESNIGFSSNNEVDTDAILTFAGTSTASVTTVYDQSGNSNNYVQTTALKQPFIAINGSICRFPDKNNRPALLFSGAEYLGVLFNQGNQIQSFSIYNVYSRNVGNANWTLFDSRSSDRCAAAGDSSQTQLYILAGGSAVAFSTLTLNKSYIYSVVFNSSTSGVVENRTFIGNSFNFNPGTNPITGLFLGSRYYGGNYFHGYWASGIVYKGAHSISTIYSIQDKLSKYYGAY